MILLFLLMRAYLSVLILALLFRFISRMIGLAFRASVVLIPVYFLYRLFTHREIDY